jgi:hypothetical protein
MALKSFTVTLDGDRASEFEFARHLGVMGTVTLYRVRAKKSSAGGYFKFNIDHDSSKTGKVADVPGIIADIDPVALQGDLADGDTVVDISNWSDGSTVVAATGDAPEWMSSGDNITGWPAIDFTSNGGDERMTLASPVPSFASGEPFSIAIVVDNGNNNNKPAIGSDVGSGTYASKYGTGTNRNTMIQDESGNLFESTAGGGKNFKNKDIHIAVRESNDRVSCWRRGVNIINGQLLDGTFSPSIIGNARQGSSWSGQNANFSRILIAEEAWSTTERENLEAWLAWKYDRQTGSNSYLNSSHPGHHTNDGDPRTTKASALTADADLSSLGADTWSGYYTMSDTTISGSIGIYAIEAYKAGTVTVEITVSY